MNVAYIISAYKLPQLLVRLVTRLAAPGTSIYIHVDARTAERDYRAMVDPIAARTDVWLLRRHPCHWGDFGHVRATLKGLRALIESGRAFDYVVLLTGQDYPIRPNVEIAKTLCAGRGAVYLHGWPLPTEHWDGGGLYRVEHWHFHVAGRAISFPGTPFRSPRMNALWSLPARLLGLRRKLPGGLRPFGGSSYWMIPADCARYVDEFARTHPGFVRFFEHVTVPDELFFHTVIMNSPFRERVTGDALRYVAWEVGSSHPRTLTMADYPSLAQSSALFARKFDPEVDAAVLDRLDEVLDGGDRHAAG